MSGSLKKNRNPKVVIVVPTYNEADNIRALIRDLFALKIYDLRILVVDDASPDGTSEIVEGLRAGNPGLSLITRKGDRGRGLAGREGFIAAMEDGADIIVEMDADFSHQPSSVPSLLQAIGDADVAIGSRLVKGGRDQDRGLFRQLLTRAANTYARILLGVRVGDMNSGFRCFSRKAMEAIRPETLRSVGPSIVHEVLFRASRAGMKIIEVPIEFLDRKEGTSKLTLSRLAAGYVWILRLRLGL